MLLALCVPFWCSMQMFPSPQVEILLVVTDLLTIRISLPWSGWSEYKHIFVCEYVAALQTNKLLHKSALSRLITYTNSKKIFFMFSEIAFLKLTAFSSFIIIVIDFFMRNWDGKMSDVCPSCSPPFAYFLISISI